MPMSSTYLGSALYIKSVGMDHIPMLGDEEELDRCVRFIHMYMYTPDKVSIRSRTQVARAVSHDVKAVAPAACLHQPLHLVLCFNDGSTPLASQVHECRTDSSGHRIALRVENTRYR